jgi:penicillin-binding protein 2
MPEIDDRLNPYDPGEYRNRFRVLFWVVLVAVSLIVVRLWYLQVIQGHDLRVRSENNRVRLREIKALRGIILDSRGVVLVDNRPSFDVFIYPEDAKNVQNVIETLEGLYKRHHLSLSEDYTQLLETSRPLMTYRLDRNISREKLALVETHALELPGVTIDVMPVREYFFGESMAHVIGYTGEVSRAELEREGGDIYKSGDIVGKSGIERYLDAKIRGKNGGEQIEVNVVGKKIRMLGRVEPTVGYRVVLTLDSVLQRIAWDALEEKAGSVIALNPRDGSILAMVSKPSFDPNLFNRGISPENWEKLTKSTLHPMENKAISGQYPPGSTYKLIVAAAGLEEGVITPHTAFNCDGTFDLGTRTYRCWRKGGHGRISLHRAIVESCDVYFYNVGRLLGVDTIAEYAYQFGLGKKTGVNLLGEKAGLIPTKDWKLARFGVSWQPGETISVSIGQGFNTLTPLQLLNAYCAVANRGTIYTPRVIRRIEKEDGQIVQEFPPEPMTTVDVSLENLELLSQALWGVCNEPGGTGHALRRKEADACGKTGTAQVIGLPEGTDANQAFFPYEYRDHALFVCFAPKDNPEIAVVVVVEHGGHGASAAAPVARKVIDGYFANRNPS